MFTIIPQKLATSGMWYKCFFLPRSSSLKTFAGYLLAFLSVSPKVFSEPAFFLVQSCLIHLFLVRSSFLVLDFCLMSAQHLFSWYCISLCLVKSANFCWWNAQHWKILDTKLKGGESSPPTTKNDPNKCGPCQGRVNSWSAFFRILYEILWKSHEIPIRSH